MPDSMEILTEVRVVEVSPGIVPGPPGADGVGVPPGGTTAQVLGKASDGDFDTAWINQTGGGGGGAPTNAPYYTFATDATLTNERVLTFAAGDFTVAVVGNTATVNVRDDQLTPTWANVQDKPSTFPPEAHTHTLADVTDAGEAAALDVGTTAGTVAAGDDARFHPLASMEDTPTIVWSGGGQVFEGDVVTQHSVTSDANGILLVGDAASPGNAKYYGTDGAGAKGWFDLPSGGSVASLNDIGDVTIASPSPGQVLTWDGSGWANDDPPASGGAPTNAPYYTFATDATLTNERVLTFAAADFTVGVVGSTATVNIRDDQLTPTWANVQGKPTTLSGYGITDAVPSTRTITAGTGLTGGGDLSADRTLTVSYGSSAGTACEGDDPRLSDARDPTAHALIGSDHTVSGLTTGHVLQATGAATFGFGAVPAHDQGWGTITGTPTTLAGYGITDAFDGAYSSLSGIPSTFTPSAHTHTADDITSGELPDARVAMREDIVAGFDGGGEAIANSESIRRPMARACTITLARIVADQTGSITITVNKYTPTDETTMGAATELGTIVLTSENNKTSGVLAWSVGAGDILEFVTSGAATVERVVVTLKAESS